MAASVNCPKCNSAVDMSTDAFGRQVGFCEECNRKIAVRPTPEPKITPAKVLRRPTSQHGPESDNATTIRTPERKPRRQKKVAGSNEDQPKSKFPIVWIAGGVALFLVLLGGGVGAFFVLKEGEPEKVVIVDEEDTFTPGIVRGSDFVPETTPEVIMSEGQWTTFPEVPDPKNVGFTVQMPADAAKDATSLFVSRERITVPIRYTSRKDSIDCRAIAFDLAKGAKLTPEIVGQFHILGAPPCDEFLPTMIDGHPGFRGTAKLPYIGYCAYSQVGHRVFVFSARHMSNITPIGVDIETVIDSVKIDYDNQTSPPPNKDVFLKSTTKIDAFTISASTGNRLVTFHNVFPRSFSGIYPAEGTLPDDGYRDSGKETFGTVYNLPDLTVQMQVKFDRTIHSPQYNDGIFTSIEATQFNKRYHRMVYYLHTHDSDDIQQSKRVVIPVANLKQGDQVDGLFHYDSRNKRVYFLSSTGLSDRGNGASRDPIGVHMLRQVHLHKGEINTPILIHGTITGYQLSKDGKFIYCTFDETPFGGPNRSEEELRRLNIQRGIVVIDAERWQIVHTFIESARLLESVVLCPVGDDVMLVAKFLNDPRMQQGNKSIEMMILHPNGKTVPIQVEPNGKMQRIYSTRYTLGMVLSSDNRFGILGPFHLSDALRFKLDLARDLATVTDYAVDTGLDGKLILLPGDERVILPNGKVALTASFSDRD